MNGQSIYSTCFSPEFCEKWRTFLKSLFDYRFENNFAILKNFSGKTSYSYLPIISYTDYPLAKAKELAKEFQSRNFQIRILNFEEKNFEAGSPTTSRINFEGLSFEEVKKNFSSRLRRYLINTDFSDYALKSGKSDELINDFYSIFQRIMHRHGTPSLPRRAFFLLRDFFEATFFILASKKSGKNLSGAITLQDKPFTWLPWSGTIETDGTNLAGHYLYYHIIKNSYENGDKFFDFGRSAFLSSIYEFKRRWGAVPIKIEILSNKKSDIYNKYKNMSKIWKLIPVQLANSIGPKICKYLEDL